MRKKLIITQVVAILVLVTNITNVFAQAVIKGFADTDENHSAKPNGAISLLLKSGNKVIAGTKGGRGFDSIYITKHSRNGVPSPEIISHKIGKGAVEIQEAILLENGFVMGVGSSYQNDEMLIVKFDTSGNLDNSFGKNGVVRTNVIDDNNEEVSINGNAIAINDDGKIFTTGWSRELRKMFVACYMPNGQIDKSFGENGFAIIGSNTDTVGFMGLALKILKDGKIALLGKAIYSEILSDSYRTENFVAMLSSNGNLIKEFGKNGIETLNSNNEMLNSSPKEILYNHLISISTISTR